MMFLETAGAPVLAISQPAHAWVAGQLLRAWPGALHPQMLLAAEQHDVAWLDWETRPVWDPSTGRPKLFRDVGVADHAPVWSRAVQQACCAWGTRVALMISRHGGVIYSRFTDRHRTSEADAAAATAYVTRHAPMEAAWASTLGLSPEQLDHETNLIAFAETLSLGLCGGVTLPLDIPDPAGGPVSYRMKTAPAPDVPSPPGPSAPPASTSRVTQVQSQAVGSQMSRRCAPGSKPASTPTTRSAYLRNDLPFSSPSSVLHGRGRPRTINQAETPLKTPTDYPGTADAYNSAAPTRAAAAPAPAHPSPPPPSCG